MLFQISTLSALLTLSSGHFLLDYPMVRGFDEDILGTFPCMFPSTYSHGKSTKHS